MGWILQIVITYTFSSSGMYQRVFEWFSTRLRVPLPSFSNAKIPEMFFASLTLKTKATSPFVTSLTIHWWSRRCVLASSTQVRGFKPGRSRRIFQGEKIPSTPSFGGELKPVAPCRFTARKISLNFTWKSAFRQNSRLLFVPPLNLHLSPLGSLTSHRTWRHLAATVGISRKQGVQ
jgi:hypothetical protein